MTTFAELDAKAAEAGEVAARLDRQRAERQVIRNKAAAEAELEFWRTEEKTGIAALRDARDKASAHWRAAAENPASTLDELMDAFTRAQKAEEIYRYGAADIWFQLDQIDPLPPVRGEGHPSRRPATWFNHAPATFGQALDGIATFRQAKLADDTSADRAARRSAAVNSALKATDKD